jgi:hypothetical protein
MRLLFFNAPSKMGILVVVKTVMIVMNRRGEGGVSQIVKGSSEIVVRMLSFSTPSNTWITVVAKPVVIVVAQDGFALVKVQSITPKHKLA